MNENNVVEEKSPNEILEQSADKLAEIATKLSDIFRAGYDAGFIGSKNAALLEAYKQEILDYINEQLDLLISGESADGILNTINELSKALNNDENAFSTLEENINKRVKSRAGTNVGSSSRVYAVNDSAGDHIIGAYPLYTPSEASEDVTVDSNKNYKDTIIRRSPFGTASIMDPTQPKHIANKKYVDYKASINTLAGLTKGTPSSVQIVYADIIDTGAMPTDEDGNPISCTTREFIKNMDRETANIEFPHSRFSFSEGKRKDAVNLTDIPTDYGYVTLAWDTLYRVRGMCYDANTSDVWVYTYRIDWEKEEDKSIDENIWYHYGWKKLVGYNGGDICAPTLDFVSPNNSCGGFLQRVFTHPNEPHNCGMIFGTSADVKNKGSSERSGIKFMHAQRDKAGSVRPIGSRASFFFTCDDLYEVELDPTTGEYKETETKINAPDTGYNFTKVNKDNNPKTDKGREVFLVTYNTDKKTIKKYYCAHETNSLRWFEAWGTHNILFDSLTSAHEAYEGEIEEETILSRYRGRAMKRDSNGRCSVMGPTQPKHVANKEYVDNFIGNIKLFLMHEFLKNKDTNWNGKISANGSYYKVIEVGDFNDFLAEGTYIATVEYDYVLSGHTSHPTTSGLVNVTYPDDPKNADANHRYTTSSSFSLGMLHVTLQKGRDYTKEDYPVINNISVSINPGISQDATDMKICLKRLYQSEHESIC